MSSILLNTVIIILFFAYVDSFCKFPEYFHFCGRLREPSCTHPEVTDNLKWDECLTNGPGCRCHDGYVRNYQTKTCMRKEKCFVVTLANAVHKTLDSLFTSIMTPHKCK
ncbi:uncharacterized protein [Chelonus insularis]|uniref:uncharacterized protein n=1 Tax=Chelonus insularis TaxID=460826 RepID=UPI00158D021F|nr:uncharacterized protein LOC118068097 [Chelonus insularis]